jgi:hypothetical protein
MVVAADVVCTCCAAASGGALGPAVVFKLYVLALQAADKADCPGDGSGQLC